MRNAPRNRIECYGKHGRAQVAAPGYCMTDEHGNCAALPNSLAVSEQETNFCSRNPKPLPLIH